MSGADGLISVDEHLAVILAAAGPLDTVTVPISAARGRTLREAVTVRVDIPVFDNSAMDGFAVRYDDVAGATAETPVTLRVIADLPAGTASDPALASGEAARIMTGSPTPTDRHRRGAVRRHTRRTRRLARHDHDRAGAPPAGGPHPPARRRRRRR